MISDNQVISIEQVTQLEDYKLQLLFNDHSSQTVDFQPFLTQSLNPLIRKYLGTWKHTSSILAGLFVRHQHCSNSYVASYAPIATAPMTNKNPAQILDDYLFPGALAPEEFAKFEIDDGDLEWNDYDLCFPIADLYENRL